MTAAQNSLVPVHSAHRTQKDQESAPGLCTDWALPGPSLLPADISPHFSIIFGKIGALWRYFLFLFFPSSQLIRSYVWFFLFGFFVVGYFFVVIVVFGFFKKTREKRGTEIHSQWKSSCLVNVSKWCKTTKLTKRLGFVHCLKVEHLWAYVGSLQKSKSRLWSIKKNLKNIHKKLNTPYIPHTIKTQI